jgi:hypothetical protein
LCAADEVGLSVPRVAGDYHDSALLCRKNDFFLDFGSDVDFAEHVICEVLVYGVRKEANDLRRALWGLGLFHSEVLAPLVLMCRSRLTDAGE